MNLRSILSIIFFLTSLSTIGENDPTINSLAEQNGMSSVRLKKLKNLMQEYTDSSLVGSCVGLIARNGKIVFLEASGEMGVNVPMRTEAIARIASITKTITATAVMMLMEEGKIKLNDPIANFLPEYAKLQVSIEDETGKTSLTSAKKFITIYDLLTHQAGIASGGESFYDVWDKAKDLREFSKLISEIPLESQPGTEFKYGAYGSSYELLAAIIEIVTGQTFKDFLEKRILGPLKLDDTYFYVPEYKKERLAAQYKENSFRDLTIFRKIGQEEKPSKFYSGGGGLRSTVEDYFRFAQMLLNGGELDGVRLLSPKSVQLMTTNHMVNNAWGKNYGWGLGCEVRIGITNGELGTIGTFGWNGGTGTKYIVDPVEKLVAIIFVPSSPRSIGTNRLRDLFINGAYQSIIESYAR